MRELLSEIFESLKKNKLRSFLTGFSIAWGIFMIVILLGSGNGLMNGLNSNLGSFMQSRINIYSYFRNVPYEGYPRWSSVYLTDEDISIISGLNGVWKVIPSVSSSQTIRYGEDYESSISVNATTEESYALGDFTIVAGRYINRTDMVLKRKSVVLDEGIAKEITDKEYPLGKKILLDGVPFTVIGIAKGESSMSFKTAYIPVTTYSTLFKSGVSEYRNATVLCEDKAVESGMTEVLADEIAGILKSRHHVSPDDKYAIDVFSNKETADAFRILHTGLNVFIWFIGIGTLFAGVVGVSNIMLVSVRERTHEIGVRKTFGARSGSIILMVLSETLVITVFSGYVGMISGVFAMEGVNWYIMNRPVDSYGGFGDISFFKDPTLRLPVVISCTAALIIASLIAGYIPAKKAAGLKTIDALRYNK